MFVPGFRRGIPRIDRNNLSSKEHSAVLVLPYTTDGGLYSISSLARTRQLLAITSTVLVHSATEI